jgi:hypothetical protein
MREGEEALREEYHEADGGEADVEVARLRGEGGGGVQHSAQAPRAGAAQQVAAHHLRALERRPDQLLAKGTRISPSLLRSFSILCTVPLLY